MVPLLCDYGETPESGDNDSKCVIIYTNQILSTQLWTQLQAYKSETQKLSLDGTHWHVELFYFPTY